MKPQKSMPFQASKHKTFCGDNNDLSLHKK